MPSVVGSLSRRQQRRSWGSLRTLPSGRVQARYPGPDGRYRSAPMTFDTKADADAWLAVTRTDIARDEWQRPAPPKGRAYDLSTYPRGWLAARPLAPRTRAEYQKILDDHVLPTFGQVLLPEINPPMVRDWYAHLTTGPTRKAHAYSLLKTILATAVTDDVIATNPCRIRSAGVTRRARTIRPASLAELGAIVELMPDQYRAAVLLAAWCALRFGEVAELRRKDIDLANGRIRVRRAVTYVDGSDVVGAPKSEAESRDVAIPPHLLPIVRAHLVSHTRPGRDGLLFASADGGHLRSGEIPAGKQKGCRAPRRYNKTAARDSGAKGLMGPAKTTWRASASESLWETTPRRGVIVGDHPEELAGLDNARAIHPWPPI